MEPEGSSPHSQVPAMLRNVRVFQIPSVNIAMEYHSFFVFGRSRFRTSARKPDRLAKIFRGSSQFLRDSKSKKGNFHPTRVHKGPGGSRSYSSTHSSTSPLDGVGGQRHAPAALPPGKTRYPLYRRLGGPPWPVWTGAKTLAPTGIRSPDRPARSESLYRLSYRGPQ